MEDRILIEGYFENERKSRVSDFQKNAKGLQKKVNKEIYYGYV